MQSVNALIAQANNNPFTSVFGENVLAQSVKTLVDSVRANNINAENSEGGLGYIYIVFDGKMCSPIEVSKAVKNGKSYIIDYQNESKTSNLFISNRRTRK